MYWRIWWKEARQFWPIWAFLIGVAAALQWFLLEFGGDEIRNGVLPMQALGWTWLYGMAAGAAAFAGERENGTLKWLDALAAPRGVVWRSKVGFAVITTFALMCVLLLMAAPFTNLDSFRGPLEATREVFFPMIGAGVLSLAFGFLCSAVMTSALAAAVSAIGLTAIVWTLLAGWTARGWFPIGQLLIFEAFLTFITLGLSYVTFRWPRREASNRPRFWPSVRFQNPIVIDRPIDEWTTASQASTNTATATATAPATATVAPAAPFAFGAAAPVSSAVGAIGPAATAWPRSRWTEVRHLVWQTVRQGRSTWCLLLLLSLALPSLLMFQGPRNVDQFVIWLALATVMLTAGTAVFNFEQRGHGQRFLAQHGARPGTVWLVKLSTWVFGVFVWLAIVAMGLIAVMLYHPGWSVLPPRSRTPPESLAAILSMPLIFFAVAQLFGMIVPRGITAWVVAMVTAGCLAFAMGGLMAGGLLSPWGFAVVPLALLAATWLWSGDWLFQGRPPLARYGRLAAILLGIFGALFLGYTGSRAWGVADPGPIVPPSTWTDAASRSMGSPDNAAPLYREALRLMGTNHDAEALALVRQAAARPYCRFFDPDKITLANDPSMPNTNAISEALARHAQKLLKANNLLGAWNDIVVLFRTARHIGEGATRILAANANVAETQALNLAIEWALAPGQSAERLRSALDQYRALPAPIPPADVVRGEALLFEHTLNLPVLDLRAMLLDQLTGSSGALRGEVPLTTSLYVSAITTPWEIARARRIERRDVKQSVDLVEMEAYQLKDWRPWRPGSITEISPLARLFTYWPVEPNEIRTRRRGLEQLLAVREWQARHDGEFPTSLNDLVPGAFGKLPLDPYSGKPFGYLPLEAADPGLIKFALNSEGVVKALSEVTPDSRLLYSVGPNGQDGVRSSGAPRVRFDPRYTQRDDPMRRFAAYGVDDLIIIVPPWKPLEK